jgi:hypothetical protein
MWRGAAEALLGAVAQRRNFVVASRLRVVCDASRSPSWQR